MRRGMLLMTVLLLSVWSMDPMDAEELGGQDGDGLWLETIQLWTAEDQLEGASFEGDEDDLEGLMWEGIPMGCVEESDSDGGLPHPLVELGAGEAGLAPDCEPVP